jgi:peptidyl-Lys metalloendopeptidase
MAGSARAQVAACSGTQLAAARAALTRTKVALDKAISAIDKPTQADVDRLGKWLGVRSSADAASVRQTLVQTRAFSDGVTFKCAVASNSKLGDFYAYVDPSKSFLIVLGDFFFAAADTGFSSKLGILIHEISHFTLAGATKDPIIYGTAEAQRLAAIDPAAARGNAENIEYFVEAVSDSL